MNALSHTYLNQHSKNESQPVKITWKGWRGEGKVAYTKNTATRELINNVLTDETTYSGKVSVQVVFDTDKREVTVTDDFIGFFNPTQSLPNAMNLGMSYKTPAILSAHGRGMKTAVNWWTGGNPHEGWLEYIRTSNDGSDFFDLTPDLNNEFASFYTKKSKPILWYDLNTKDWVAKEQTGTQIKMKVPMKNLGERVNWYTNLVASLEASYHLYLGEQLDIDIIWLKNDELHDNWELKKRDIIFSGTKAIQEGRTNPSTGLPFEMLYKATNNDEFNLGPNTYEIAGTYKHNDYVEKKSDRTGIEIDYEIGYLPHNKAMYQYFEHSGDNKYDSESEEYKQNPFRYKSEFVGLSYTIMGVPIKFGNYKASSRSEALFGTLEIRRGIETTATKDDIVMSESVERFEKDFADFLRDEKLYVRSSNRNLSISEADMEEKLLERLKDSSKLRKYLSINTRDFDSQYALHSGYPDIVPMDLDANKPTDTIIEIKKERAVGRMWKAIVQGQAYAYETGLRRILIVSMDPQLPSDVQTKVDILNQNGWKIRYESYFKLTEL